MKHKTYSTVLSPVLSLALSLTLFAGCRSNPNRAEKIDTALTSAADVAGERVGVHAGEMVVQSEIAAAERLRDLQNQVYALEDQVYGTRKLGSSGLFGQLRACKRTLATKAYGGDGTLTWTEPLDRISDKETEMQVGLSPGNELVGVSREYLRDRLTRFSAYKLILQKRSDEFTDRVESCRAEIRAKQPSAPPAVAAAAAVIERDVAPAATSGQNLAQINAFMCGFVRPGASLKDLMLTAFARGWLTLTDFGADKNLIVPTLNDRRGKPRENAMLFNGWRLAFDQPKATLGDLFTGTQDARLVSWAAEKVANGQDCLPRGEGAWNP